MDDLESSKENLPDISDQATQKENQFLEAAIDAARHTKGPKATGLCLNCEEPLAPAEVIDAIALHQHDGEGVPRWCNVECCSDWQKAERMRKINGE